MAKPTPTVTDTLGVAIRVGDVVTVIGWGWNVRLIDTGRTFTVTGITWAGNLTHDTEVADGYSVHPSCVAVARRDGKPGHEGNRATCPTCGDPLDTPTGAGRTAPCSDAHNA